MMRAVIATFLILFSTFIFAGAKAEADRTQVGAGESFTLTLSTDDSSSDQPDLSILEANFDIVGTSNSSNISIINGQMSSQKSWQIQLIPKQKGTIIIPGITFGNEKTQPITIEVTDQPSNNNASSPNQSSPSQSTQSSGSQSNGLHFETTADKHEVYVQGQIVYTQRFSYPSDVALIDEIPVDNLSVPNASIEPLNTKGPNHIETINGEIHQVMEATYAIFPEKSGALHIPSQTVTVRMRRSMFDPPQVIRLRSEDITINVLPQPNHDNPWLPAKTLSINESWSANPPVFKVGESITRKITIEAEGLNQSQLPALPDIKLDGIKTYADKPETKNTVTLKGIVGKRTDSVAIVATKAGTYTLPPITIHWWNTEKNKAETTSLPAFTFTVAEAPVNNQSTLPAPSVEPSTTLNNTTAQTAISNNSFLHNPWLWVAVAFLVLWALTLLLWWWTTRRKNNTSTVKIKPLKKETSVSLALDELTSACRSNDAGKVREALLQWAMKRWATPTISLEDIALKAPSLSGEINALEQALYAKHTSSWQGDALLALIKQLPPVATGDNKQKSPLASLYPNK